MSWGGVKGLSEEVTFEQRPDEGEEPVLHGSLQKNILEATRVWAKAPRWDHAWQFRSNKEADGAAEK